MNHVHEDFHSVPFRCFARTLTGLNVLLRAKVAERLQQLHRGVVIARPVVVAAIESAELDGM